MKRSPSSSISLEKAIIGFLNFKIDEGLSPRSTFSYQRILEKWVEYMGNRKIGQITEKDINEYLIYMRTEYKPKRFSGRTHMLSLKTIRNIWVTLSSFFSWAKMEFQIENPVENIPAPKFPKTVTEPYTQEEIARMIKACTYSREAETIRRKRFVMRRPCIPARRIHGTILPVRKRSVRRYL